MHLGHGWDMGEKPDQLDPVVELYNTLVVEFVQRHLGLDSVQAKLVAFEVAPAPGVGRVMLVQLEMVELCEVKSLHHGQAAVALVVMK